MSDNKFLLALRVPSIFASFVLLTACSEPVSEAQSSNIVQAVKLIKVISPPELTERTFPAEVSAVKTIDVRFEVTGRISELELPTGSKVNKGEILAKIDPSPFERRVKEQSTRLEQSHRELTRVSSMHKKNLVSQSQLDNAKTAYELAEIGLANAKQDLTYTVLRSPFDAQVSERIVENDSYVKAGDIIARLQDVSRFYFNINVPERLLTGYKKDQLTSAQAQILAIPNSSFPLTYVEHSTQADPITQTFKVVFAMDATEDFSLVPGSRAQVTLVSNSTRFTRGLLVPLSALIGNKSDGFHVWKFNVNSSQVDKVEVSVLHLEGEYVLVTSGKLKIDDLVVAAGSSKMSQGLTVKPYQPE